MKSLKAILSVVFLISSTVLANECSLYQNTSIVETAQSNKLHIPTNEVETLKVSVEEFRSACGKADFCHTKDAVYTSFKKQLGTTTEHNTNIKTIKFIGEEYETSKKGERFVDLYEVKGAFSIKNDLMVCGYKEPILYVKINVEPTRMSLFNELVSPNSVFSRNHVSEFENMVIQDI